MNINLLSEEQIRDLVGGQVLENVNDLNTYRKWTDEKIACPLYLIKA